MANELSDKAAVVLEMIAGGYTYDQIIQHYPNLTYLDIFRAAEEALHLARPSRSVSAREIEEIRQQYPRHMKPWEDGEEAEMRKLFEAGKNVRDIAKTLQRKPSAIRSRLIWLGLLRPPATPTNLTDRANGH